MSPDGRAPSGAPSRHGIRAFGSSASGFEALWKGLVVAGFLGLLALPAWGQGATAARWLRIQVPEARNDLWVDVERGRVQVGGSCEGGVEPELFERSAGRLRIEWLDEESGSLPGTPVVAEQRFVLELEGTTGTLRVEGSTTAVVVTVRVSPRDGGPSGCR